ncbi:unnamed protein product [Allacma fusca]|uniref:DUF4789 domain-containing protein n=1 Tax=Allacma fusca TaxID=39272 RepID=A0A8J2JP26_9HEXA|nr:unnamed protein product [Allacma fusca]
MKQSFILPILLLVTFYFVNTTRITVSVIRRGKALKKPSKLCPKDGPGWAYHNQTGKCYKTDEQGPCDTLMKFSQNVTSPDYGICECNFYKQCGRPVVHWQQTGKCYFVNDQGPCAQNEWLTLKEDKTPVCSPNNCQVEQSQNPSNGSAFWVSENGTCYRTTTRGYCEDGTARLFFKWQDYKATCNYQLVCGTIGAVDLAKFIKDWQLMQQGSQSSKGQTLYTAQLTHTMKKASPTSSTNSTMTTNNNNNSTTPITTPHLNVTQS